MNRLLVALCICLIFGNIDKLTPKVVLADDYFTDTPPEDYFQRNTTSDCETRFYWNIDKFNQYFAFGGQRAFKGEFQHMVALGWTTGKGIEYLCGGTLISTKFVLTAAHCGYNAEGKAPDTVRLGDTNLGSTEDDEFAQQIKIRTFKKHPKYRPSRKYYDIALIELDEDVVFNEAVCPACLWLEESLPLDKMDAMGFGITEVGENLSTTLQKVQLSAIGKVECVERLPLVKRALPNGLVEEQFCAGSENMDTCEVRACIGNIGLLKKSC